MFTKVGLSEKSFFQDGVQDGRHFIWKIIFCHFCHRKMSNTSFPYNLDIRHPFLVLKIVFKVICWVKGQGQRWKWSNMSKFWDTGIIVSVKSFIRYHDQNDKFLWLYLYFKVIQMRNAKVNICQSSRSKRKWCLFIINKGF